MNEFEWRRQLRGLRQPHAPNRDLWPAIDAAMDSPVIAPVSTLQARPPRRRRWLLGAGLAASLLVAGSAGWHLLRPPVDIVSTKSTSNWKPADPRLAGAAIELDAARMELELAIQQAPDSAALQRLLRHTERQQAQLRQLANRAS